MHHGLDALVLEPVPGGAALELVLIAWARKRFLNAALRTSLVQVTLGGIIVVAVGVSSGTGSASILSAAVRREAWSARIPAGHTERNPPCHLPPPPASQTS